MAESSLPKGRRLLLAGFGGLLALLLIAGTDALLVLREIRSSEAQARDAYLRRTQALERVRAGVYQSAILLRDYLLAGDELAAQEAVQRWSEARSQTERALVESEAALEAPENPVFQQLRAEIGEYWHLREAIIDRHDRRTNPYASGELVRRRTALLAMIDRIDQISAQELAASDTKLNATADRLRLGMIAMLFATLVVGVLLAAFTVRRTLHLETELQRRVEENVLAKEELQHLSARLVSAQEEERRSISRELHDEVGQSLSALLMEAGHAAAAVPQESLEARRHVESIKRLAEASVQVIRNMTLLLRPSMLDDFGLVPALEWQAREVSKRTGLRVQVDAEESADQLPDAHKTCIYRVVQEALHNVVRHGHARSVKVEVRQEQSKIRFSVADDGRGFEATRVRGLGLVGMQERVNHLGGAFHLKSHPGQGTRIEVELPIAS
jgi:signal transduction histidine kinase